MNRDRSTVSYSDMPPASWRRGSARPARSLRRFAVAAGVLLLTACVGGQEEATEQNRNPYTAVSPTEESSAQAPAQESAEGGGGALDDVQMAEVLLDEDELPFIPDQIDEVRGTEYFHEHIGVAGGTYVENFGQQDCAQQMDTVNERLVGEEPLDGLFREARQQADDGGGSFFLWMLSYEEPPERGPLWDEVLEACDEAVLAAGEDQVSFSAFSQDGFRGLGMDMTVENGADLRQVEGFSATLEYGNALLMISAVNGESEDFHAVVQAQAEKLEAYAGG